MRTRLYPLALLLLPYSAMAGGFGVMGTGGAHGEQVYFYDSSKDNEQHVIGETLPHFGAGVEFVLGDRDDKISGIFRGFWLQDAAQKDPAGLTQTVDPDNVVAAWRDQPRNVGIGTFGVQWGFLGDPDKAMLYANTSMGSGFLTTDHTEFLMGVVGPGATYHLTENVQAYAEADYVLRYRKGFSHGVNGFVGVRWLFD